MTKSESDPKIQTIGELKKIIQRAKKEGKKIVLAHGAFDLLHHGHLHYLSEAKKHGDVLVVSVVSDEFVRKGLKKPLFDEHVRTRSIALLSCADYVVLCNDFGPWNVIKEIRPHVYTKGENSVLLLKDFDSGVSRDKIAIEKVGGKLAFMKNISAHPTSVIGSYLNVFPDRAVSFIDDFRKKFSAPDIIINIEKLRTLKALIIGEAIIDEYRYVTPLGKPAKAHVVTTHYKSHEEFAGGVIAGANHLAGICGTVELVTLVGLRNSKKDFIQKSLKPNVKATIFPVTGQTTIIKRRFMDKESHTKFFEEYEFDKKAIPPAVETAVKKYLNKKIKDFDIVVVIDYGHGFLTPDLISLITDKSKFLALTAQTNSGNAGFNYITKYPKADLVCVDELEARLACHDDVSPIEDILSQLSKKISAKQLIITLGSRGLISRDATGAVRRMPAFAEKVTDAVGSGDAFLCVSAPCAAAGFNFEMTSFIGSVSAAIAVTIVGNKSPVERDELFRHIGYLLE